MNTSRIIATTLLAGLVATACWSQGQFQPPRATIHYAPDRALDLLNVTIDIQVDYEGRAIKGRAINTLAALQNGVRTVALQAGKSLDIQKVTVDGQLAKFARDGSELKIDTPRLKKGQKIVVSILYQGNNLKGRTFGAGGGGWHWIVARKGMDDANHVGFWTQGETEGNRQWAPTWDHPNDFATTETRTTVPANWTVVGNGSLISQNTLPKDKKRKTFVWRMTQPHATYLLSLVGGPFDIKKDLWEGVDLWYVVPKGDGYLIDDSFGDTKDMLSYYSTTLGTKYAWSKYAQNAMYDFGGGMENVSAATLGEGALSEARDGFRNMASLNAHELAHQWFGDLVTCMDWGDTWLNESFATFMEAAYMEHSRGRNQYAMSIDGDMQGYLFEARRYKRPLSTRLYSEPDAMFDSHAYPKGATVIHTLRRQLGEDAFWSGLKLYLSRHRNTPVQTYQLCRAFTDASGINCESFFDQWVYKPGHPVLDYTWTKDAGKIKLTVKQTQKTDDGTPIYSMPAKVLLISADGTTKIQPIQLSKAEETFELAAPATPAAVLLDPNHDFLREIPTLHWAPEELPAILKYAPNCSDRQEAMKRLLANSPSTETVALVLGILRADNAKFPTFPYPTQLDQLSKPEHRSFWLGQLDHPNSGRQALAVTALSGMPADAATTNRLRALITPTAPLSVVIGAIDALAKWDAKANLDVFKKAQGIKDRRGRIKRAADSAIKRSEGS